MDEQDQLPEEDIQSLPEQPQEQPAQQFAQAPSRQAGMTLLDASADAPAAPARRGQPGGMTLMDASVPEPPPPPPEQADPNLFTNSTNPEHQRQLNEWRGRLADSEENATSYMGRRMLPFYSTVLNTKNNVLYGRSRARIQSGDNPTEADFERVATHERLQEIERNYSTGQEVASGLAHVPALVGEALLGGAALRGAAAVLPRAAPFLATTAEMGAARLAAPAVTRGIGQIAAQELLPWASRTAAQTVVTPSMWMPGWTENNNAAGRDPLDLRGLPPAFALGFAQTAVLGRFGRVGGSIGGTGARGIAARLLVRTGTGMAEQQAIDILSSATEQAVEGVTGYSLGLPTGYGLIGDVLRDDWSHLLRHATVQAATFAVFSGMHEAQEIGPRRQQEARERRAAEFGAATRENAPAETPAGAQQRQSEAIMDSFAGALEAMHEQGLPQREAARQMSLAYDTIAREVNRNPNLTQAEAMKAAEKVPEGPARDYAVQLAKSIQERTGPMEQRSRLGGNREASVTSPTPPMAPQEAGVPPPNRRGVIPIHRREANPVVDRLLETPNARMTPRGEIQAEVGGRQIYMSHDPARNVVRIDFEAEKPGVPGALQKGSTELARSLKSIIGKMVEQGVGIEYRAVDSNRGEHRASRADIYGKTLKKAGYEQTGGPGVDKNDRYVWTPKAKEPAKAPEWTAKYESLLKQGQSEKNARGLADLLHPDPVDPVKGIAKALGVDPGGSRAAVMERIKSAGGEAFLTQLEKPAVPGSSTGIPGAQVVEVPVKPESQLAPRAPGSEVPLAERIRQRTAERQAGQAEKALTGPVESGEGLRQTENFMQHVPLEELARRDAAGMPVTIEEVATSVGWSSRELDIISRLVNGETLQSIGDAHDLTRERIRQISDKALEKEGIPRALVETVRAAQKSAAAVHMKAKGKMVNMTDLHADLETSHRVIHEQTTNETLANAARKRIATQIIKESENGQLSADRVAFFERETARIAEDAKSGKLYEDYQAQKAGRRTAKAKRGAVVETPVQRGEPEQGQPTLGLNAPGPGGETVQPRPNAERLPESAGQPENVGQTNAPGNAQRGAAGGNELDVLRRRVEVLREMERTNIKGAAGLLRTLEAQLKAMEKPPVQEDLAGLTSTQRATLAKTKDPILRQNFLNRWAGAKTLFDNVMERGGLDPAQFTPHELKLLKENFPKQLFQNGGAKLDLLAESLLGTGQRGGTSLVGGLPRGTHPSDHILNLLREHYVIEGERAIEKFQQSAEHQHFREKAYAELSAENPSWTDAQIERRLAEIMEGGESEGHRSTLTLSEALEDAGIGDAHEGIAADRARQAAGVNAGDDFTLFHDRGTSATGPGEPGGTSGAGRGSAGRVGPFETIAKQNELFDNSNYIEKRVPGSETAQAGALLHNQAIVTKKIASGDPRINLEENVHIFAIRNGFEADPAKLGKDIAEGFRQFYDPKGPANPVTMMEGLAQWFVRRSAGELNNLSPQQEAASKYAEKWLADKGFTKHADAIQKLYEQMAANDPVQAAASLINTTGEPIPRVKDLRTRLSEWFQDNVESNLSVLKRLASDAAKNSFVAKLGQDAYTVYSRLMYADKATAGEFETQGAWTLVDGKKTTIGQALGDFGVKNTILETLLPQDMTPVNGEVSRASVYVIGRHVLGERSRGRDVVSKEQFETYSAAMKEFAKDPAFMKRAEEFAKRLTEANLATLRVLEAAEIHFLEPGFADKAAAKYPDYAQLSRAVEGEDFGKGFLKGRTGESGAQIIDPIISYKKRLSLTSALLNEQIRRNSVAQYLLGSSGLGDWGLAFEQKLTVEGQARYREIADRLGLADHEVAAIMKEFGSEAVSYFTSAPWPSDGSKPTWTWRNQEGKLVNFRIRDRALYDLITGQQGDANSFVQLVRGISNLGFDTAWGRVKPFELMNQVVRTGATAVSLGFQVRNIFPTRDPYEFAKNTIDQGTVGKLPEFYSRAYGYALAELVGKTPNDVILDMYNRNRGEELRKFTFDKSKPQSAYDRLRQGERGTVIKALSGGAELVKRILAVAGAGENAPRALELRTFLEQNGWSEAKIEAEYARARAAQESGAPYQDPVPFHLQMAAMEAANEVTVPFSRTGTIVKDLNKIHPFFGPSVAGLSKALRNWRSNTKGAAIALAGMMSLRLLHWLAFKDEDWYSELTANDRFNNFVVPIPGLGLRRLPGARDLDVPSGGSLTVMLDAASGRNPDFAGLIQQSVGASVPPLPITPAGQVGTELARNRNWMGVPIVPRRDENRPAMSNALEHQLPYAAQQLTGGRAAPTLSGAGVIPFSEVRNAHVSVDRYYERLHALESARTEARRTNQRFVGEGEYQRLHRVQQRMQTLAGELRGERRIGNRVTRGEKPTPARQAEIRRMQIDLARRAMAS